MRKETIDKLLSGRLFLTVIGGIAFAICVWKRILTPEAITSILTMIFISYFQRSDRTNGKSDNMGKAPSP